MKYSQLLKKYWGFDSFRKPQKEIISKVVEGKDVLAILPTGSGKTIIYQISGLSRGGLTLVISPLVALIEDQNAKLNQLGIKSIALTGGLSFNEMQRLMDNALFSDVKFLFISPERLQNSYIQNRLKEAQLSLIVVDEAHCISEWGHDFRPSYLQISLLREISPETPFLALTATAGKNVSQDIVKYLKLNKPEIFRTSVRRENLKLLAVETDNKMGAVINILNKKETALIYVSSRRKTLEISQILSVNGFKAAAFHGGMDLMEKQKILRNWLSDKFHIIVATNAFGMGIDKPNVRKVIHFDLPFSLENYIQEAGRAGRDGKKSKAILLFTSQEIDWEKNFYLQNIPTVEEIVKVYKSLYNHYYIAENEGENLIFDFDYKAFCKRFDLPLFKTYEILKILESEEIIQLIDNKRFLPEVKISASPQYIRDLLNSNFKYAKILDTLIRLHSDIFLRFVKVKTDKMANVLSYPSEQIFQQLNKLSEQKIVDYKPVGKDFQILFLAPKDTYLLQRKIKNFEKRILLKKEKVNSVLHFVHNNKECRGLQLQKYFGEENLQICNACDVCDSRNFTLTDNEVLNKIQEKLKQKVMTKQALQMEFPIKIDKYLSFLLEQKKIKFDREKMTYKIN